MGDPERITALEQQIEDLQRQIEVKDLETQLLAVSTVDGRYANKTDDLVPIVSEYGLISRRVGVETSWLSTLGSAGLEGLEPMGGVAHSYLASVAQNFSPQDAREVKELEKTTNHDVKAVEYWLRGILGGIPDFDQYMELIHFGATSEDINNLAIGMQIRDARDQVLMPGLEDVMWAMEDKAEKYADIPMLSHTHGQAATPTTAGKEMMVFAGRLRRSQANLGSVVMLGKFNGATGGYNAMSFAYPQIDWQAVTNRFVQSLGFTVNRVTDQIEPHDWFATFSNELALSNTIMTDLARDFWTYVSMNYFTQEVVGTETGSSTMPHKVNPIDFENAEGNFGVANALLGHFASKLPVSRMQRDLTDLTVQRAVGEAFGHTTIAHQSLLKGLGKVHANPSKMEEDLGNAWPVLTEAVQSVLRKNGVEGSYDIIKERTRGAELNEAGYRALVESLDIPQGEKDRLLALTPATYLGYSADLAKSN